MTSETPPLDVQHALALSVQLGRSGADDVEVGWLNETKPFGYWAKGTWAGDRVYTEHHAAADLALFALARKVIHGGLCTGCQRAITFPHLTAGRCGRVLVGDGERMEYRRLCDLALVAAAIEAEPDNAG